MMKKTVLLLMPLLFANLAFGQTVEESIKNAEKLYKQNNYKEAIQSLDNAIKEIENSYLKNLKTDLLPQSIGEYSVQNIDNQSYISGNRIQIQQRYEKANNSENSENANFMGVVPMISITISNSPEKLCETINNCAMDTDNNQIMTGTLKPMKYKDYRALIQYYEESKQGKFSIIIGGAVIEIIAENIENEKILTEAANKIDTEKIIKYFGK